MKHLHRAFLLLIASGGSFFAITFSSFAAPPTSPDLEENLGASAAPLAEGADGELAGAIAGNAANLLLNPGFEFGAGGDAENWLELVPSSGGGGTSTTRVATDEPHSGEFHMRMQVQASSTSPGESHVLSDFTLDFPLDDTEPLVLTFQAKRGLENGPGLVAQYRLSWFNAANGPLGDSGFISFYGQTSNGYQPITSAPLAPPAGATKAQVLILFAGGAFTGSDGQLFIDDFTLVQIPEPQSAALLALSTAGLCMRRRRSGG